MHFEWDEVKNRTNIRTHGLDFSDASRVFGPTLIVEIDDREDYGETRWAGIGVLDGRVVKVIFTEPNENTIRIISLRRATKYERDLYAKTIRN